MSVITVKLAPNDILADFYFGNEPVEIAKFNQGEYKRVAKIVSEEFFGKEAAEEIFDLTNNPERQKERLKTYGNHRSLSLGDIVNVDGTNYLCAKFGWIKMD